MYLHDHPLLPGLARQLTNDRKGQPGKLLAGPFELHQETSADDLT
jgi:hypothetical protein